MLFSVLAGTKIHNIGLKKCVWTTAILDCHGIVKDDIPERSDEIRV